MERKSRPAPKPGSEAHYYELMERIWRRQEYARQVGE